MDDTIGLSILTLRDTEQERAHDFTPSTFDDYIGQDELKEKLSIYTQAAKMRGEPLDHLLLFGPPGLGKTTLAHIMAQVMHVGIKICSGPMMERTGDLVAILSSLEPRDILFIDEIHRMPATVEEVLYSAMEQFRVDVIIGQGAGAKSVNLPLSPFTLVGATTKSGKISAPLRSRFGIVERLDFYTDPQLQAIVAQNARFLELDLSLDSALLIAQAGRGTPRIAKKIVRRVRDFAQVKNNSSSDIEFTKQALSFLGIDTQGLTNVDRLILSKMIEHFSGGPVGVETIAALVGEDKDTIEQVYEPFLMRKGLLEKTARGRQIPHKQLPFLKQLFLGQATLL
ncbi:Holliday junction branch migration DNA helicase RuvB [Candidatus Dependentiae bacterium]|nr:Holliday junction branch migration DNA helicase RuvB [Candidatus Dependentiae bacterium]MCC7414570.1 Holliday junction branch migration DNA helicase RuvB [Campylobacterota bacterium]